jgi:hypothetical protein
MVETRAGELPLDVYVAKCFWPEVAEDELQQVTERAQADLESHRSRASYLGSICFPSDDLVLCLFDASSPVVVKQASERLGIPCERVMPAVWMPPLGRASTRCAR